MQKYAKYMNDTSKALMVMDGNDADTAKAWGMELMDVAKGYDGAWYKSSELPVKPNGWKSPEEIVKEEAEKEAQRIPDVEDAVMELAEVVTTETEDNSNAIVDLANYVAEMEARIAALEAAKEN